MRRWLFEYFSGKFVPKRNVWLCLVWVYISGNRTRGKIGEILLSRCPWTTGVCNVQLITLVFQWRTYESMIRLLVKILSLNISIAIKLHLTYYTDSGITVSMNWTVVTDKLYNHPTYMTLAMFEEVISDRK
jgi:hypothetical protein